MRFPNEIDNAAIRSVTINQQGGASNIEEYANSRPMEWVARYLIFSSLNWVDGVNEMDPRGFVV